MSEYVIALFIIYIIIREVLFFRYVEKVEKKLMAKDLGDYTANNMPEEIDPDYKENKIAKDSKAVFIEDIPNPFADENVTIGKGKAKL